MLLLHTISARGIPQGADGPSKSGRGSSDPYCRFLLLDNVPTAKGYSKTAKKQMAFTSYKQNADCPEWEGERLQIMLTPGGDRPLKLQAEIWEKDMHTPDQQMAGTVVTLPSGVSDTSPSPSPPRQLLALALSLHLALALALTLALTLTLALAPTLSLALTLALTPPSRPTSA